MSMLAIHYQVVGFLLVCSLFFLFPSYLSPFYSYCFFFVCLFVFVCFVFLRFASTLVMVVVMLFYRSSIVGNNRDAVRSHATRGQRNYRWCRIHRREGDEKMYRTRAESQRNIHATLSGATAMLVVYGERSSGTRHLLAVSQRLKHWKYKSGRRSHRGTETKSLQALIWYRSLVLCNSPSKYFIMRFTGLKPHALVCTCLPCSSFLVWCLLMLPLMVSPSP